MITSLAAIERPPGLRMAVWLKAKVRDRGPCLQPRLHAGCGCVAQRRYSCSMRLAVLWKYCLHIEMKLKQKNFKADSKLFLNSFVSVSFQCADSFIIIIIIQCIFSAPITC